MTPVTTNPIAMAASAMAIPAAGTGAAVAERLNREDFKWL